jgi:hypothetical protein
MTIPVLFVCAAVAYLWWTAPASQPDSSVQFRPMPLGPPPAIAPKAPPSPISEREQLAAIRRRLAADELLGDDLRKAFDLIADSLPVEAK